MLVLMCARVRVCSSFPSARSLTFPLSRLRAKPSSSACFCMARRLLEVPLSLASTLRSSCSSVAMSVMSDVMFGVMLSSAKLYYNTITSSILRLGWKIWKIWWR